MTAFERPPTRTWDHQRTVHVLRRFDEPTDLDRFLWGCGRAISGTYDGITRECMKGDHSCLLAPVFVMAHIWALMFVLLSPLWIAAVFE